MAQSTLLKKKPSAERGWTKTKWGPALSRRRSKDTEPEIRLRSALHALGLRFRLHRRFGRAFTVDIALPRFRVAVFCDGCFWHGCPRHKGWQPRGPNARLWSEKFERTAERDVRVTRDLEANGWRVVRFWECQILADPIGVAMKIQRRARQAASC
jgi:DNA mismatch endonuclease (patch repair protein)